MEIMAQLLNKDIISLNSSESGALGIGVLCGLGTDIFENLDEAIDSMLDYQKDYYQGGEGNGVYEENYQKFIELYERNKDLF